MRKSRYVGSLLLGAAAFGLAGCDDNPDMAEARVYPTLAACVAERSEEECRKDFAEAQAQHEQTAPRFADAAACKEETGGECQQATVREPNGGTSSFFMPALAGFMLGRAMGGGMGFGPRPVYYDRDGFMRSGNARVSPGPVPRGGGATSFRTPVSPAGEVGTRTTTSRGGFGQTSGRYTSGGS